MNKDFKLIDNIEDFLNYNNFIEHVSDGELDLDIKISKEQYLSIKKLIKLYEKLKNENRTEK